MTNKNENEDLELYNDEQRFFADYKAQLEMTISKMRSDFKLLNAQMEFAEAKIKELA